MNQTRVLFSLTAVAAVLSVTAPRATAFPPFAKAEGKPCSYCHVDPKGGGKRNYRGVYYKGHNNSFVEFDDAAEAKKAGEEIGPEPDPHPKSWTAPKGAETPGNATANEPKTEEKKLTVKEAAARVKVAEATYNKAKTDPAKKKAYAAALADLAHATMLDTTIPPRTRYPAALKLTRRALAVDPTNKTAADDKKAIEDAYKSMNKPIPQK